jgi:hypothetical protein
VGRRKLGAFESLDGFPSLDPALDVAWPAALTVTDGGTIRSQGAQSYTQWVPLHDVDASESILPPGSSERPGEPSRLAAMSFWGEGRLRPAPLSRAAVEALGARGQVLAPR